MVIAAVLFIISVSIMHVKFLGLVLFIFPLVRPLKVILERAKMISFDPKYVEWGKSYVVRYGRQSPYYLNIEGRNKHTWNNNTTIHILFFEFLNNQYRRTFVEMHMKLCDALNVDPYVGKMLAVAGVTCPLPPAEQHVMNMTIEAAEFPNVWPFKKGKVDVFLSITDTEEVIFKMDVHLLFLQKKKN